MKKFITIVLMLIACVAARADKKTHIQNDCFWYTVEGTPMFTNGGGIFTFTDPESGKEYYYWYGVKYKEAADYVPEALGGSNSNLTNFMAVTCYRSEDLINWQFVNEIVTTQTLPSFGWWVGRCGVAYVKEKQKYALFIQFNDLVGVFTCDTPGGKYAFHQTIDMKSKISTTNTGDQTVFTDTDGQSYLCYSKANGRNKMYISKIGVTDDDKIGLVDCKQIYSGSGREGNCMFKYKDKYYICASDLYGWNASNLYYFSSDNVYGPYTPTNSMSKMSGAADDYGHVTQTGCFFTVRGTEEETVIACGDRWAGFAGNGNGFSQWCPVSFDNGSPYFNSLSNWTIDHVTGHWSVGTDNNYAVNASFEADRVNIPSGSKPSQSYLRGWTTNVVKGNQVVINGADTPTLNAKNSKTDRKDVIGNFAMNISDKVDFSRKVYQTLKSTQRVPIQDGCYRMSAKTNCSDGFNTMKMYAKAKDYAKTYTSDIARTEGKWVGVEIPEIIVKGGQVEIGFEADAAAGSQCRIDDVEFVFVRPLTADEQASNGDEQSAINDILVDPSVGDFSMSGNTANSSSVEYYTIEGVRTDRPTKGLNIVVHKTLTGNNATKQLFR